MTAYNPDEVERLIERVRTRYAKHGAVASADALDLADQVEAARARIAELEATSWTLRQQLDGLQANLTDARREASALRDRRGLPSDG